MSGSVQCTMAASRASPSKARSSRPWVGLSTAITIALSTVLLAACAERAVQPDASHAPSADSSAAGYVSAEHDSITTSTFAWSLPNETVNIVIAEPSASGSLPVIVYLPGLGETSSAGVHWRTAWATAGYAVISVQLLDEDANAWSSALAREGDFKALGRQRYAAAAVDRRVKLLATLVADARKRAVGGGTPWQRLDWNRAAIAGFDLGAYTTMAVAGERVPGAEPATGNLNFRAAIVLSPYAMPASTSTGTQTPAAADSRYAAITLPVMSITSNGDDDALGLVDDVSLRETPFLQMPGPDKYMLVLRGVLHSGLGGNPEVRDAKSDAPKRRQTSSKGRRGAKADDGTVDLFDTSSGADMPMLTADALQRRQSSAQALSIAFLDAYVRGNGRARDWLSSDLSPWLGVTGQLRRK